MPTKKPASAFVGFMGPLDWRALPASSAAFSAETPGRSRRHQSGVRANTRHGERGEPHSLARQSWEHRCPMCVLGVRPSEQHRFPGPAVKAEVKPQNLAVPVVGDRITRPRSKHAITDFAGVRATLGHQVAKTWLLKIIHGASG